METANHANSAHEVQHLAAAQGVHLALESFSGGRHGAVLLSHGFGQTRQAWRHTAQALAADGWDVFTYDARGHGDSGRPHDGIYELDHFIADLRLVHQHIETVSGSVPIIVGASMGGLITLLAHGEAPELDLRALVLVDIAPRWEAKGVARMLGFMQQHASGFSSLEEAREIVRAYLPHRDNPGGSLRHNLRQHDDGRWYWHWDPRMLDYALNNQQYQQRVAAATRQVSAPTLLISGGQTDMISDEHIAELMQIIPHASHVVVPKAAHMVAGDDNDRFNHAVKTFLDQMLYSTLNLTVPEEA